MNRRVLEFEVLPTPAQVLGDLPLSDQAQEIVAYSRDEIRACLYGQDDRLLVIVGPCSVHDPAAALDYARRLAALKDELGGELLIVMRVYFEKPRTTVGWKGLINDPDIDGSCKYQKRPAFGPSYAAWRIGRRFGHRHGIPGTNQPAIHFRRGQLGCDRRSQYGKPGAPPARFGHVDADRLQNATDGSIKAPTDSCFASAQQHTFFGIDHMGRAAVVKTLGNPDCHVVLRGSSSGPNYDAESVANA